MTLSLILDLSLAILLIVTIGYAVSLNSRLGMLRQDKEELEKLASTFANATLRAEDGVGKLKNTAELLQQRVDKAQSLRDDLVFLIDRGGSAADRLEESVRTARKHGNISPKSKEVDSGKAEAQKDKSSLPAHAASSRRSPEKSVSEVDDTRADAERELLKALQAAR
jgi:cobalamin biosynthesis Mg chelatase CobN